MRLATLAHAMSSTRPTAPMNTNSAGRIAPTIRSCSPMRVTLQPALLPG